MSLDGDVASEAAGNNCAGVDVVKLEAWPSVWRAAPAALAAAGALAATCVSSPVAAVAPAAFAFPFVLTSFPFASPTLPLLLLSPFL